MVTIVLLALAAAVYPQLLAVVLLILTLPRPRMLLWVCCASAVIVSIGANAAIFAVFRARGTIAGTSETRLGPLAYLVIGLVAGGLAAVMATIAGRDDLARPRQAKHDAAGVRGSTDPADTGSAQPAGRTSKIRGRMSDLRVRADAELHDGSVIIATIAGALLAIPGPFDFLAVGRLARGFDTSLSAVLAIIVFVVIKFVLIEVPSVAYAVAPDDTADRVKRVSAWMHTNKLATAAAVVGLVGGLLVVRGVAALL